MSAKPKVCPKCKLTILDAVDGELVCGYCGHREPKPTA